MDINLPTGKSARLENPFVAKSRFLIELLFALAVGLLMRFASGAVIVHSWSSQLLIQEKLAYPPVLIRVKAVYYTAFPAANIASPLPEKGTQQSSIE
jgi:hypothetical protein